MIPCKNCLTYGVCKNKNIIDCIFLFKWLRTGRISTRNKKYDKALSFLFDTTKEKGRLIFSGFVTTSKARTTIYFLKSYQYVYKGEIKDDDTM